MSAVPLKLRFSTPLRLNQAVCFHAAVTERFYSRYLPFSSFQLRSYRPWEYIQWLAPCRFYRPATSLRSFPKDSLRHRLYFLTILCNYTLFLTDCQDVFCGILRIFVSENLFQSPEAEKTGKADHSRQLRRCGQLCRFLGMSRGRSYVIFLCGVDTDCIS